jgi:hypothetical protein
MLSRMLMVKVIASTALVILGIGTAGSGRESATTTGRATTTVRGEAEFAEPGAGVGAGSDVSVVVPPIPSPQALPGLCVALLAQGDSEAPTSSIAGSPALRVLIGATGGSVAASTAWCHDYLKITGKSPQAAEPRP